MKSAKHCRPAFAAILAVIAFVGGQLAALAHNAETRHVECPQHGELLEAPTLVDELHACDHDHFVGVEGEPGGDHDDCSIARALREHLSTSGAPDAPAVLVDSQPDLEQVVVAHVATVALYLVAPKTSPPRPS